MASCSLGMSLGTKRLNLIHSRVEYMLELENFDENEFEQPQVMCTYCSNKFNLDFGEHPETKKFIYYRCSGKEWICQARHECACVEEIPWNKDVLMSHKTYVHKVTKAIETMEPRIALISLHKFHQDITKEQHHMVKMTQVGEQFCYPTFTPFRLDNDMFPLPAIGQELSDYIVPPWNGLKDEVIFDAQWKNTEHHMYRDTIVTFLQTCNCLNSQMDDAERCVVCEERYERRLFYYKEGDERLVTPEDTRKEAHNSSMPNIPSTSTWNQFSKVMNFEASCGNQAPMSFQTQMKTLNNLTVKEALTNIHAITGAPNPCDWCQWRKVTFPHSDIHCTGIYKLCYFKFTMFEEMPYGLNRYAAIQHQIMKCSTVKEYRKFMDKIFSVDEIQRAITLKLMIDDDISFYYPFMGRVMALYDALILRWYWGDRVLKETVSSTTSEDDSSDSASEAVIIEYTNM